NHKCLEHYGPPIEFVPSRKGSLPCSKTTRQESACSVRLELVWNLMSPPSEGLSRTCNRMVCRKCSPLHAPRPRSFYRRRPCTSRITIPGGQVWRAIGRYEPSR